MTIEIIFFGQLTDITGKSKLQVSDVNDTDALVSRLYSDFPALSRSKFRIAVNNKIINNNTPIIEGCKIAFMPPFSGG